MPSNPQYSSVLDVATISPEDDATITMIEQMADTDPATVSDLIDRVPYYDRARVLAAVVELERLCGVVIDGAGK